VLALISSRTAGWPGGGSAPYSPVARRIALDANSDRR